MKNYLFVKYSRFFFFNSGGFRGGRGGGFRGRGRGRGAPKAPPAEPRSKISQGTKTQLEEYTKLVDQTPIQFDNINNEVKTELAQVELVSNFFHFQMIPNSKFYIYDVKFNPEQESKAKCHKLIEEHLKDVTFFFNGLTQIIAPKPMFTEKRKAFESVKGRPPRAEVTNIVVTFASEVSSKEITAQLMQMMSTALESALEKSGHVKNSRLHLKTKDVEGTKTLETTISFDKYKIDIAPGLIAGIVNTQLGLMLNTDVANRLMRRETLWSWIQQEVKKSNEKKVSQQVKDLSASYIPTGKRIRLDGIEWQMGPDAVFQDLGRKKVTYADDVNKKHNIQVQDYEQPMVYQINAITGDKIYYIPELMNLAGHFTEDVLQEVSTVAGMGPERRLKTINYHTKRTNEDSKFKQELAKWNMQADVNKFIQLVGKRLNDVNVVDGSHILTKTEDSGKWTIEVPFRMPESFKNWVFVYPPAGKANGSQLKFLDLFKESANKMGFPLPEPSQKIEIGQPNEQNYSKSITKAIQADPSIDFFLIVLNERDSPIYSASKQNLILMHNKICSCVLAETIKQHETKGDLNTIAESMVYAIISKLGGAAVGINPTELQFPGPTMVIGSDAFHSGERFKKQKQSNLGFVSTVDRTLTRCYSQYEPQAPGQEISDGPVLQKMFKGAIREFKKANKNINPGYIIWYRDGVGEGQQEEVLNKEITEGAKKELIAQKLENCKLIVIIVLKRIHSKFFNVDNLGNTTNPLPGTVVDTSLTEPGKNQFYLISQKDIAGCVTPTKYQILYNEPNFSLEYLERVTFQMTHLYGNWAGTTKVPHLCIMAHKLAEMGGSALGQKDTTTLKDRPYYL